MSLELKIFAVLVFLCAVVICIAIHNSSRRISEAIESMTINVHFIPMDDEEETEQTEEVDKK